MDYSLIVGVDKTSTELVVGIVGAFPINRHGDHLEAFP